MPLTDKQIKALQPGEKPQKFFDGNGLYLEVAPSGGKWWRLKYRFEGKEKRISLGTYPDVSLKEVRERAQDARRLVQEGIDPSVQRRRTSGRAAHLFRDVGREWFERQKGQWKAHHQVATRSRLERLIFPRIGDLPADAVTPPDVLTLCRAIEISVSAYMSHVVLSLCSRIMRYAVACSYAQSDPCRDLLGALTPHQHTHMPALTKPDDVSRLLKAMDIYNGAFLTKCALQLLSLTFVRGIELRGAQWTELDIENALWRIPAERMKMGQEHLVPLSRQVVNIFSELRSVTGHGIYLFPSRRSQQRIMSENTINAALSYMGFTSKEMVGHGFRAMASTLLNERGWSPDVIERQLAHAESNKVRAAYNRAQYLEERRKMMQAWADYLDELRSHL